MEGRIASSDRKCGGFLLFGLLIDRMDLSVARYLDEGVRGDLNDR
jgi:hypothetical protein